MDKVFGNLEIGAKFTLGGSQYMKVSDDPLKTGHGTIYNAVRLDKPKAYNVFRLVQLTREVGPAGHEVTHEEEDPTDKYFLNRGKY